MRRRRRAKPVTWVHQIFEDSAIAKTGGPVRRRLSSILNNSSPKVVIDEAGRRGWRIIAIGDYWLFYSDTLRQRQVLGRSTALGPRKPRRKPTKHRSKAFPAVTPSAASAPATRPRIAL